MSKPKLTYFDMPMSRGEECRLAFTIAGVDFDDNRISRADWPALKPSTPFGSVPVLDMPGQPTLGQVNAILVLIGRLHGVHPEDAFEAARHEAMMCSVEDLRAHVTPSIRITDEAEKKTVREALVAGYLPTWAGHVEKHLGSGPFFAGAKMHVVDLKLHMAVRWFNAGNVDYIPATVFSAFPKLNRLHDAVRDDARVKAWYAKK
ncbi:MAG: glutathione S-transferase family protein [Polyangiaceae bacterium]